MVLSKREVRENIYRLAREYAESGKYSDYQSVEYALIRDWGYSKIRVWINRTSFKEEIDGICKKYYKEPEKKA